MVDSASLNWPSGSYLTWCEPSRGSLGVVWRVRDRGDLGLGGEGLGGDGGGIESDSPTSMYSLAVPEP